MAKTLTFEFPESDVTEMETLLAQMQRVNQEMRRDQAEIDNLKTETRAIAEKTREVLAQLEASL